jgi:hypothetical protein
MTKREKIKREERRERNRELIAEEARAWDAMSPEERQRAEAQLAEIDKEATRDAMALVSQFEREKEELEKLGWDSWEEVPPEARADVHAMVRDRAAAKRGSHK